MTHVILYVYLFFPPLDFSSVEHEEDLDSEKYLCPCCRIRVISMETLYRLKVPLNIWKLVSYPFLLVCFCSFKVVVNKATLKYSIVHFDGLKETEFTLMFTHLMYLHVLS